MSTHRASERRVLRNALVAGAAGAALAAGALWAADNVTGPAVAQDPTAGEGGFTLSVGQLRINQRISSAAVRRSNESLALLDPIRPVEGQPGKVLGWRTGNLVDGAVTEPKLAPQVTERLALWAVVEVDGTLVRNRRATASSIIAAPSFYRVDFDRPVRGCSFGATLGSTGQVYVGSGEVSVFGHPVDPAAVVVVTHSSTGALLARPFHLRVNC